MQLPYESANPVRAQFQLKDRGSGDKETLGPGARGQSPAVRVKRVEEIEVGRSSGHIGAVEFRPLRARLEGRGNWS